MDGVPDRLLNVCNLGRKFFRLDESFDRPLFLEVGASIDYFCEMSKEQGGVEFNIIVAVSPSKDRKLTYSENSSRRAFNSPADLSNLA